jgi:hypothetical protein
VIRSVLLAAALLLGGCIAPVEAPSPTGAAFGDPNDTPAYKASLACLDAPPCVERVYCNARGADEDDRCDGQPVDACLSYAVPRGQSCFPTADVTTGFCDGRGACVK